MTPNAPCHIQPLPLHEGRPWHYGELSRLWLCCRCNQDPKSVHFEFLKRELILSGPDLITQALNKQRVSLAASEEQSRQLGCEYLWRKEAPRSWEWSRPTASKQMGTTVIRHKEMTCANNLKELGQHLRAALWDQSRRSSYAMSSLLTNRNREIIYSCYFKSLYLCWYVT